MFLMLWFSPRLHAQNWNLILKAAAGDRENKNSSARSASDYYGFSVAISGNFAIVGAYREDQDESEANNKVDAGAAYILFNNAGTWTQIKKLTPANANRLTNDFFGYSVAISGDYAVVGAYLEDEDESEANTKGAAGSAYIFKKDQGGTDNWGLLKKITPANANRLAADYFGWSVAISGDYAVVGAYGEDEDASEANTKSDAGSAYIFKKDQGGIDNWGLLKKITPANTNRLAADLFGWSVAISGDYAVVGAIFEDEDESEANTKSAAGSAYIFKKDQGGTDNWGLLKKITPANANRSIADYFGYSVAISGEYVVVGAYLEDEDEAEANTKGAAGSAYIFKKDQGGTDNWGLLKKITPVNANRLADDYFGVSVAISEDYVIVGAYQEDEDETEANTKSAAGSAYIFKKDQGGTDNWGLLKKITPANANRLANDNFGITVAISGNHILVGAPYEDEDEFEANTKTDVGSSYIFKKDQGGMDNWGLLQKTVSLSKSPSDYFGWSVAISGDYAIVGAANDGEDNVGSNYKSGAGSAYILKNTNGNWSQIRKITPANANRLANDYFGSSVAIFGNYAIVGAPYEDEDDTDSNTKLNAGSAYVFKQDLGGTDNWGLLKKITPANANRLAFDRFGNAVSITDNYLIVGAPAEDEDASEANTKNDAGSAYIFKKDQGGTDNWGLLKKITPANANRAVSDLFGFSVAINGEYVVVGAYQEDEDETETNTKSAAGSAYIFKKDQGGTDNWGLLKKITPANANRLADDYFGRSVAINGNYAIVGAPSEDEDALEANTKTDAGAAYIFKKNQGGTENWGLLKKITPANANRLAGDNFGCSVAISGNYAILGAYQEDEDEIESNTTSAAGSAYIFTKDQGGTDKWGLVKKIAPANASRAQVDNFGWSVAISGNYAFVGAYREDEDALDEKNLNDAGAAYFFYNGCHPTSRLPSVADSTYTSSYKETDALGWTHYCTSKDELLLSLKMGSSGAVVNDSGVRLKTGTSTTFSSTSSGGMIFNTNGYSIIDRRWDVSAATQPSSGTVGVKYYFTNAEYLAEVAALAALSNPSTITSPTELNMYKATSGSAFADPHTVSGIILFSDTLPSTSNWLWAQQGPIDHSAEFEVTSFSGGGGGFGGGSSPLPVTLLRFTGQLINNDGVLFWSTASEINNDKFEIERSVDGRTWNLVGSVNGHGNSHRILNYSFTDLNIAVLPSAYVLYRLKQIDYDLGYEYSGIVQINLNKSLMDVKAQISPNPFNNQIQVIIPNSETEEEISIQLVSITGAVLMKQNPNKNENGVFYLNTQHIPSGIYFLKISQRDGDHNYKVLKE